MNNQLGISRIVLVLALILMGAMSRMIPHPPNFTAIVAIGFFAAYQLRSLKFSMFAIAAAMLLSDLVIGPHSLMFEVYGAMLVAALIGHTLRNSKKAVVLGGGVLASSLSFFVLSNLAIWVEGVLYPTTMEGFVACYVAAIPFLKYQVAGDMFFSGALFGAVSLVERMVPGVRVS